MTAAAATATKLRLITLDMTGTVFKFKRAPLLDYIAVARKHEVDEKHLSSDLVQRNWVQAFKHMSSTHPHFGSTTHVDSKDWWLNIVHGAFKEASEENFAQVRCVANELYDYFSTGEAYEVYPDALDFLRTIKEHHPDTVKTGIITNYDRRILTIIEQLGLSPLIDFKVYSESAKASKPDVAMFHLATEMSRIGGPDLAPEEALHVGDELASDYVGAKRAGWRASLIDRDSAFFPGGGCGGGQGRNADIDAKDVHSSFSSLYASLQAEQLLG